MNNKNVRFGLIYYKTSHWSCIFNAVEMQSHLDTFLVEFLFQNNKDDKKKKETELDTSNSLREIKLNSFQMIYKFQ